MKGNKIIYFKNDVKLFFGYFCATIQSYVFLNDDVKRDMFIQRLILFVILKGKV